MWFLLSSYVFASIRESGGDKSTRAKFFNEYVNRKIQNIRKEFIRKGSQMEEKNE
jgi:hypothetical protein